MTGAPPPLPPAPTPLAAILAARIAATGPITLADYMAECLTHPDHGYYTTRDPIGRAGDFTTAPEISQMFGELLGLALARAWLDQGAPAPVVLAELGPGHGTLMADALRAIRALPALAAAVRPHLVELSPRLVARQRQALAGHHVTWLPAAAALPEAPLLLLANEFFDALPVRQFERRGAGWAERMVGLDAQGRLAPGLAPPAPLGALAHRIADTREGEVVEICPAAPPIVAEIAGRIARHGGGAILVDYGGWNGVGDTFQAVRGHAPADPFAQPGLADLTAHVDFAALARAATEAGARAEGPVPQGRLLGRLGIDLRAERLAQRLAGEALARHRAAHRRLTHDDEMGRVFQALALTPPGAPAMPGFAPNGS